MTAFITQTTTPAMTYARIELCRMFYGKVYFGKGITDSFKFGTFLSQP